MSEQTGKSLSSVTEMLALPGAQEQKCLGYCRGPIGEGGQTSISVLLFFNLNSQPAGPLLVVNKFKSINFRVFFLSFPITPTTKMNLSLGLGPILNGSWSLTIFQWNNTEGPPFYSKLLGPEVKSLLIRNTTHIITEIYNIYVPREQSSTIGK